MLSFKDNEIFGGYSLNEVLIALGFPIEAMLNEVYVDEPENIFKVSNDFAETLFFLVKVYNDVFGSNLFKDNYDTYDVFTEGLKVYLRHKNEDICVLEIEKDSKDENRFKVFNNFKPLERIINKILKHLNTAEIVDLKKLMRNKKFQYVKFFEEVKIELDLNNIRKMLKGKEVEVIYEYPLIVNNIRIDGWYPKREKILFDNLELDENKYVDIEVDFIKEGFDFFKHYPIPDLKDCIAFYICEDDEDYMSKGIILKTDEKTLRDIKNLIIMDRISR